METPTLDQSELNGFVHGHAIADVLKFANAKERTAINPRPTEYRVVDIDDLNGIRTDAPKDGEPKYLSFDNALAILPPEYGPRDIDGIEYPAVKGVPVRYVKGFSKSQVSRLQESLFVHRESEAQKLADRVAKRKAKLEAWLSGDPDVTLNFMQRSFDPARGLGTIERAF